MSFFGKEYTYVKEENDGDFLKGVGLPAEDVAKYLQYKPVFKIDKDGSNYIISNTSPSGTKVTKFTSGVEFDEVLKEGFPIKTTYVVEGNKISQVITSDKGSANFVRIFKDDGTLEVTITATVWSGVAKRFYKA